MQVTTTRYLYGYLVTPQNLDMSLADRREYARKACLVRGIHGGCMVYHHFRYWNRRVAARTGLPIGFYRAPHFHVLGFLKGGYGNCRNCEFQKNGTYLKCRSGECNGFEAVTRRAFEKDGTIVKVAENEAVEFRKRRGERKTIGGTVFYELNHASLDRHARKRQNVVTWFGSCNRRKMKLPKGKLPQKENLCHICQEPMYKVKYLGDRKELGFYLKAFKRSTVHEVPLRDENGNWKWKAVHEEGG